MSLSISATFNPRGSDDCCVLAGINCSLVIGSSPNTKSKVISFPSLITFAFAEESGLIWPTTCGRSELNLISLLSNSIITSPGTNPALSADSPSSTSLIRAP